MISDVLFTYHQQRDLKVFPRNFMTRSINIEVDVCQKPIYYRSKVAVSLFKGVET